MLGSEAPRAPLTNIAVKAQNDLMGSAPEERSIAIQRIHHGPSPVESLRAVDLPTYTVNLNGM